MSHIIRIWHNINKKKDILNRNLRLLHFYALNTCFGLLLHELLHQCGVEAISLWRCWGVMEAQLALIGAFRSSALKDSLWGRNAPIRYVDRISVPISKIGYRDNGPIHIGRFFYFFPLCPVQQWHSSKGLLPPLVVKKLVKLGLPLI